jgi:YidC/Oxa1 family membrane protein insertase
MGVFAELWMAFKEFIFMVLQQLEGFVGDWGLAIVLLTVLIRLLLTPLTMKQTKSMYELQRIQPKIKQLQEKYKDDKPKQQEELMKFYSENKVNPFGGCLPMLLQMPIFIALFQVLGGTVAKPGLMTKFLDSLSAAEQIAAKSTLFGTLPDITITPKAMFFSPGGWVAALPYLMLVVLFAVSVWLPQALMPGERQQKMIGAYMAVVMLYFGWISPAGVLIYWVTSSAWGLAQQQLTLRWMGTHPHDEIPEQAAKPEKTKPLPSAEQPAAKKSGSKKKKKRS